MKFLSQTLPTVAENLALDDALLESADRGDSADEVLRLWHADSTFIVVGRSSRIDVEVQRERAAEHSVPILRRVSGGTAIVAGIGCMFYATLLDLERRPHLRMLDEAHRFVMSRLHRAVSSLRADIQLHGTCDLVVGGSPESEPQSMRKVSGNSLRVGRRWMLYHGTLLVDMNLDLISQLLRYPPREPEYRAGRNHADFLANLNVDPQQLANAIRGVWNAEDLASSIPAELVQHLVSTRYQRHEWNFQRL